jgi:hypothetical protein
MIPACRNVMYNAAEGASYLLFTNHLSAHPLRNEFVIYEAEAVSIDFNGKCGLRKTTLYITGVGHMQSLQFCRSEDPGIKPTMSIPSTCLIQRNYV